MSVPAEYRNGDVSLPEDAAEIKRLRELLAGVHLIAGRFIHRGHAGFEYDEISEALAVALQELSLIRRHTEPPADAISRNEAP